MCRHMMYITRPSEAGKVNVKGGGRGYELAGQRMGGRWKSCRNLHYMLEHA